MIGIGLGIVSGLRPGFLDTTALVVTAISAAIPAFVAAIVLILLFAVQLGWFPTLGNGTDLLSNIRHLTLPAVALAFRRWRSSRGSPVPRCAQRADATMSRRQSAAASRRAGAAPARAAQRGDPDHHITGITIASLIAVSAVVETAFSLNGLGAYLVQAAQSKDLAVVQGISLVLVTAFVVVNLLVDLAYALLDPRVTLGARAQ